MITFERFQLSNGLKVIVHEDDSTPMAVTEILYDVGSRDEDPAQTGMAHLFEHLMFGGSAHVPRFDTPLQLAGGQGNASTSQDYTSYTIELPAENIETAFWLESDRMFSPAFSKTNLEVQKKVVCEEFKQTFINQPYGDALAKLLELSYKKHPYRWLTIGRELGHIERVQMKRVKEFFRAYYQPQNAILVVAGNVKSAEIHALAEKWFGGIPSGDKYVRVLPEEPQQQEPRNLEIFGDVPLDAIWKAYHIPSLKEPGYYAATLIGAILGNGDSSRLYQALVKGKNLFNMISCFNLPLMEPGLIIIQGMLANGVNFEEANGAIEEELLKLQQEKIPEKELTKIKNQVESEHVFENIDLADRAANLVVHELLGDADMVNTLVMRYQAVTEQDILEMTRRVFDPANSNTLYYHRKK